MRSTTSVAATYQQSFYITIQTFVSLGQTSLNIGVLCTFHCHPLTACTPHLNSAHHASRSGLDAVNGLQ
eukprot:1673398-Amphidinium_carterae.1